ncbi:MAG: ribonuclease HII [Chloroflexi bacterium]|nr:ribonuclease HII [Chloroflexota bacterium]
MGKRVSPTLEEERRLHAEGHKLIAGLDEVGRGALAGPVAAAAVVLRPDAEPPWLVRVRDSKLLTAKQREDLFPLICREALAVSVGVVSPADIDLRGILRATRLAMRQAVEGLSIVPQFLLIDGVRVPQFKLPQKAIVRGDKLCVSIACASIVAKVTRDKVMVDLERRYPGYGFADHKGYGTVAHVAALKALGASPVHRRSFRPVMELNALVQVP